MSWGLGEGGVGSGLGEGAAWAPHRSSRGGGPHTKSWVPRQSEPPTGDLTSDIFCCAPTRMISFPIQMGPRLQEAREPGLGQLSLCWSQAFPPFSSGPPPGFIM